MTFRSLHRASDPQGIITAFNCAGIYKERVDVVDGKIVSYDTRHTYHPETNSFLRVSMNSMLNIINSSDAARNEIVSRVARKESSRSIVYGPSKRIKLSKNLL